MRLTYTALLAIAITPLFAADLDRGVSLYQQGKLADAEKELRSTVAEKDDSARGHLYLGLTLLELGKVSDAESHVKKADELESSGETKLGLAWLAVQKKDWGAAEAAIGDASGDDVEYVRGLIHVNRQRWADAARDMESALDKRPSRAYAHYYAGLAYNSLKRPDKMLNHFELFVKMKPDAPEARKVRAVINTGR